MGWHGVLVSNMGKQYHFEIHGDEQMATQSNIHFFTNWAKERLDEMDAAVTSLEGKLAEVQSDCAQSCASARRTVSKPWLSAANQKRIPHYQRAIDCGAQVRDVRVTRRRPSTAVNPM